MEKLLDIIVCFSLKKQIITEDNKEWFRYGLSKRLSTFLVAIPFFSLAVVLSGFWTALTFYISFFVLRSRTNGYHSKTVFRCLCVSLFLEAVFLGVLPLVINKWIMCAMLAIAVVLVFALAPYNHPLMNLSKNEIAVCKKSARIRICLLAGAFTIALILGYEKIAIGIVLGCAMAGALLCFAYINEWRINHAKRTDNNHKDSQQCC